MRLSSLLLGFLMAELRNVATLQRAWAGRTATVIESWCPSIPG